MTRTAVSAGAPRIMVTNLDSVQQAALWHNHGPEQATEILVATLRTALLLGVELVVDRNQLLDGVFFLAMGPDRMAAALGLEPGARLPIVMTGSPVPFEGPHAMAVPRLRGKAIDEPTTVSMARQLSDVRTPEFLAASSALAAVTGRRSSYRWLLPSAGSDWYRGCGFTDVLHPYQADETGIEQAMAAIRTAQARWVEAAISARISVDRWHGGHDMPTALARQHDRLNVACRGLTPDPLALDVLQQTSLVRREVVEHITIWGQERHTPDEAMRLALTLWSRAYYDAIARSEGCLLMSFAEVQPARNGAPDDAAIDAAERRFGLALPPRTRWQQFRDRHSGTVPPDRSIRVGGSILDQMRIIDPGTYRQLNRSSGEVVAKLVHDRDPSAMYDLSLACQHAVPNSPSYQRIRWVRGIRIATMTLLAVLITCLTLAEEFLGLNNGQRAGMIVSAAAIGVLASLPWDDIVGQLALRRASMTATLDLREAP